MTPDPSPVCPKLEVLECFLAGRLAEAQHESVAAHVDDCDRCQRQVKTLDLREDGLVADLRRNVTDEFEKEPACNVAVQRIKSMGSDALSSTAAAKGSSSPNRPNIEQLGPYQPVELLGRGGMGEVYRAIHTKLKRPVAIKVLRTEGGITADAAARFEREMEAIGKLDHPHIVRASHADVQDGVHYLVMEYIEGLDFAQVVQQHGMLPIAEACELMRQAADGLQYAHTLGLVHRDIKPSNLMLSRVNDRGEQNATVKILDLGLALLHDTSDRKGLTGENRIMGTPDYLAPEQWEDSHDVDIRADIYSLGCTLVHMLAARPPFGDRDHRSTVAKMRAHLEQPPPNIRTLRTDVPTELTRVIDKCLAKSPADRFSEPVELANALEPLCAGADLNQLLLPVQWQTMVETVDVAGDRTRHDTFRALATILRSVMRVGHGRPMAAIVATIVLLIASASFVFWKSETRDSSVTAMQVPALVTRFDAVHFRYDPDDATSTRIGLIDQLFGAVMIRDEIRIEIEFRRPVWCYLVACNPDGQIQVCYPSDDSAPDRRANLIYPNVPTTYFSLSDGLGQQAFVLLVSDMPLPPWSQWIDRVGDLPWTSVDRTGVWVFEGDKVRQVFREGEARGDLVTHTAAEFNKLCQLLNRQTDIAAVEAIAFHVREPL